MKTALKQNSTTKWLHLCNVKQDGKYSSALDLKRPYRCDKCYRSYMNAGALNAHLPQCLYSKMQRDTLGRMVSCPYCMAVYPDNDSLDTHSRAVHQERTLKDPKPTKESLIKRGEDGSFHCGLCSSTFKEKRSVQSILFFYCCHQIAITDNALSSGKFGRQGFSTTGSFSTIGSAQN